MPYLGKPRALKSDNLHLPSIKDVLKNYLLEKDKLIAENVCTRNIHALALSKSMDSLLTIWRQRDIPTVTKKRIADVFDKFNKKRLDLLKSHKRDKNKPAFKSKANLFMRKCDRVFNIGICKCLGYSKCNCRKLLISDDKNDEVDRIDLVDAQVANEVQVNTAIQDAVNVPTIRLARTCKKLPDKKFPICSQNRFKFPTVASVLDRYKVSSTIGAAISSAALADVGMITEDDLSNVVDTSKLNRAREKRRNELNNLPITNFEGLYFDGRKDKTMVLSENKTKRMVIIEEHLSLLKEPGSEYLGHISPEKGDAYNVEKLISNFFFTKKMSMNNLKVVGCDGTVLNTGNRGGIIALIEKEIRSPVHWFICQLHANELPLRHLITYLDGKSNGPKGLSGVIGKAIETCEHLPVVDFDKIIADIPKMSSLKDNLSTDQAYLRDICKFISGDKSCRSVLHRSPGNLCSSRWLTTANRILRLYVSTKKPSKNLKILVEFIMKVYAPMWFQIKIHHSCLDGPYNLFKTITLSRYLPKQLREIVDTVINRNGYFGHPENILLAMLADKRIEVRKLAYTRISKIRSTKSTCNVRKHDIPSFDFNASDYFEIIDWNINITEPPLLRDLSDDQLKTMVDSHSTPTMVNIKKFPCHTQAVERAVKLVSESSKLVTNSTKRDGVIKVTLESRRKMPSFKSKNEFVL